MSTLLRARDIALARGNRWILEKIDLEIDFGQKIHLRGANGAGKTSLLRILAGEIPPSKGLVELEGKRFDDPGPSHRKEISMLPETLLPSPWLSVEEYLDFRISLRSLESFVSKMEVLEEWDLLPLSKQPLSTLSLGERRRVVLAAALIPKAKLLLLDEPTIGMDSSQKELLSQRLENYAKQDRSIVVASHVEQKELPSFDRVFELSSGMPLREVRCQ